MLAADLPPTPVVAGDLPDPSVIRTADGYYGVGTANSWAPIFKILRSQDLNTWVPAGTVFPRAPSWAIDDFWAPDISALGTGYALVYSARLKKVTKRKLFCTGIAFASRPAGPWRDLGRPLRCGRYGSIDGTLTRDETGRLYLIFKEDGNQFFKPAKMFAQRIAEDGRSLIGPEVELFRNNSPWEGRVVEAASIIKRPDAFYMLYSGGLCCSRKCAYAVGVARAPKLLGRWEKFSGNPILRGGNGWSCTGHTGVVEDDVLFHAYRSGDAFVSGRQVLHDKLTWNADGWPAIGTGRPATATTSRSAARIRDGLTARQFAWEFPVRRIPGVRTGRSGVSVTAPRPAGARLDGGVLARQLSGDAYKASVAVRRTALRGTAVGGIASYRSQFESIGVSIARDRKLTVWQRRKGRFKPLRSAIAPASKDTHLRIVAKGNTFQFAVSADGRRWRNLGGRLRGPIEESARIALTAGGAVRATARFYSLAVN